MSVLHFVFNCSKMALGAFTQKLKVSCSRSCTCQLWCWACRLVGSQPWSLVCQRGILAPPLKGDDGHAWVTQHVDTLEKEKKKKERKTYLESRMNWLSIYIPQALWGAPIVFWKHQMKGWEGSKTSVVLWCWHSAIRGKWQKTWRFCSCSGLCHSKLPSAQRSCLSVKRWLV